MNCRVVEKDKLTDHSIRCDGKGKNSTRSGCVTGIYWLIQLVLLWQVYGRVGLKDIQEIQERIISSNLRSDKEDLFLNLKGPLNPQHSMLANEIGFIHSKRFLSAEIKIEYEIKIESTVSQDQTYTKTRDYSKDTVYPDLPYSGTHLKYMNDYFRTLLEMFPSLHGYVSIWTDKKDSFYNFMNSSTVKEHKYKILASLLLLSEGLQIPLSIETSTEHIELVLKESTEEDQFRIRMCKDTETKDTEETKNEGVFRKKKVFKYTEAMKVLMFFIENSQAKIIKQERYLSEPKSYKEFQSGKFLNSPGFLIQTYIYYYIEDKTEMCIFIQTVHDLLCKYIENSAGNSKITVIQTKKAEYIFNRYFAYNQNEEGDEIGELKYIRMHMQNILNTTRRFPITYQAQLEPIQDCLSISKKKSPPENSSICQCACLNEDTDDEGNNTVEISNTFADHVETALLGLFCIFAYDSREQVYKVDHMVNASKELKEFFIKHKYRYGTVSDDMHNDWNKVVSGLKDSRITYMRSDKNQLAPGFMNMLYAIAEISGIDTWERLDDLMEIVDEMKDEASLSEFRNSIWNRKKEATDKEKKDIDDAIRSKIKDMRICEKDRLVIKEWLEKDSDEKKKLLCKIESIEHEINITETEKIKKLIRRIEVQQREKEEKLHFGIEMYMCELFNRLMIDKCLEVKVLKLYKKEFELRLSDIFGYMDIVYLDEYENKVECYSLSIKTSSKSKEKDTEDEINERIFSVRKENNVSYRRKDVPTDLSLSLSKWIKTKTYTAWLVKYYKECESITTKDLQYKVRTIMKGLPEKKTKTVNLNSILPWGLVHQRENRLNLIFPLLMNAMRLGFNYNHPVIRFVNNIIVDAPFQTSYDRDAFFIAMKISNLDKYLLNIRIDNGIYQVKDYSDFGMQNIIESSIDIKPFSNNMDIIMRYNLTKTKNYYRSPMLSALNSMSKENQQLFVSLLTKKYKSIEYIASIIFSMHAMKICCPRYDYLGYANELLMKIIEILSEEGNSHSSIIKGLYDLIDPNAHNGTYLYYREYKEAVEIIKSMESILCEKNNEISKEKFNYIIKAYVRN
ncbi:hypothetical protein NEAUS06_1661 [Nematocida ausubeli]|nr:hypothetical protein NEAUS06_1661 [Nematocida ausubeli]